MCDVHTYDNDDQILQDLLETNIRQRGDIGGSYKQIGRRSEELKRLYGVKQGGSGFYGNQYEVESSQIDKTPKTQKDIAEMQGMSVAKMERYIELSNAIPEIQELIDTGIVTPNTALAIMKQLSLREQKSFIAGLSITDEIANEKIEASGKKYTQRDIQKYIDDYKREKLRADELERNPKVVTETVTVKEVPADNAYANLKIHLTVFRFRAGTQRNPVKKVNYVKNVNRHDYLIATI